MKNIFKFALSCSLILSSTVFAQIDHVDVSDRLRAYLGTQGSQNKLASCSIAEASSASELGGYGNLSAINFIPCILNKAGITITTGTTRDLPAIIKTQLNNQKAKYHAVVTKADKTVGSETYNYELKLWVCEVGACSTASDFDKRTYMVWAKGANDETKGVMYSDMMGETRVTLWDNTVNPRIIKSADKNDNAEYRAFNYARNTITSIAQFTLNQNGFSPLELVYDVSATGGTGKWDFGNSNTDKEFVRTAKVLTALDTGESNLEGESDFGYADGTASSAVNTAGYLSAIDEPVSVTEVLTGTAIGITGFAGLSDTSIMSANPSSI